jgi:two-component system LytT family response regulator
MVAFVMTRPQPIDAFEPNAIDYLQLPATVDRARVTLDRARERLEATSLDLSTPARSPGIAGQSPRSAAPEFLQRIPVRTAEGFKIISAEELVSVVAHGEYMHLAMMDGERHVICYRLKDLEARLNPATFIRISRGTLVNVDCILRVLPAPSGLLTVTLTNGDELKVSRQRARALKRWLLRL